MSQIRMPTTRSAAARRLWLIGIVLGAFALRMWGLGEQELRGDEAFGFFFSEQSYRQIVVQTVHLGEPHPVASYFVQASWQRLSGDSEYWIRFPSVWFGTAAVALTALVAQLVTRSSGAAIVATLLLAFSPYALWHSQDARMYSMSLALSTAATALVSLWWSMRQWRFLVYYVPIAWLALHTHYFNGFVLLAHSVFVVSCAAVRWQRIRAAGLFFAAQLLVLVAYVPWLLSAWEAVTSYDGNGDSPSLAAALYRTVVVFIAGLAPGPPNDNTWFVIGLTAFLAGGWLLQRASGGRGRDLLWLIVLCCLLPVGMTWYGARTRPIFDERYLLSAAVPYYIIVAGSVLPLLTGAWDYKVAEFEPAIEGRHKIWFKMSSVLLVALFYIGMAGGLLHIPADLAASKTRGWRNLAGTINNLTSGMASRDVRIAQNFPDPTLWYYYRGAIEHVVLPPAPHDVVGADQVVQALAEAGIQRVLLPVQPAENWDQAGIAKQALASSFVPVYETSVGVWPLIVFAKVPELLTAADVSFANGVQLTAYSAVPGLLAPGGLLVVYLGWQLEKSAVAPTDKVFVHLVDADGNLVAQNDRLLVGQQARPASLVASYAILLPQEIEGGLYRVLVGLYDPSAESTQRYLTTEGADWVELVLIEVVP